MVLATGHHRRVGHTLLPPVAIKEYLYDSHPVLPSLLEPDDERGMNRDRVISLR